MVHKRSVRSHEAKTRKWLRGSSYGVEIGPFKSPILGIKPVYVDCFSVYAHEPCLRDYEGSACSLPFKDNSLEYVASSHLLEHVANPVHAFKEWGRVLRSRGVIYAVVPDRRFTWDRNRELTSAEHILADYSRGVDQRDGTHIDEFVDNVVWAEFAPGKSEADREDYRRQLKSAVAGGLEINIHFHVFDCESFERLIAAINRSRVLDFRLDLVDLVDRFPESCPNGFLAVMRVRGGGVRKRVASGWNRLSRNGDVSSAVVDGVSRLPRVS